MSYVSALQFSYFRCYDGAALDGLSPGAVVLYGPNGAGKTNILEALSLLVPGRGLRGAATSDIQKLDSTVPWGISATLETPYGPVTLGTGRDGATEKRLVRINGESVRGQTRLGEEWSCIWLTPQMDRLFIESAGHRRRFLDRMVFTADPAHAGRVTRYENAVSQRSKLLREGNADPAWLDGLERQMAETGMAITAARLDYVHRLQAACDSAAPDTPFPRAILELAGSLEHLLRGRPALEAEDIFIRQMRGARDQDAVTGGSTFGPNRSDLAVTYAPKNMPADQCSTGEQKALLIGIILAQARLLKAERGQPPVVLLDEVAAHLDDSRRAALYDQLLTLGGQTWLTGTERDLFSAIATRAQFLSIRDASIHPAP